MFKVILLVMVFGLSGCGGGVTKRAAFDSSPVAGQAYLAGSFLNSHRDTFARLVLGVKNVESNDVTRVELQQPRYHPGLELIPVDPGTYSIDSVFRLAASGGVIAESPISNPNMSQHFNVSAGNIYYLGHYDGTSDKSTKGSGFLKVTVTFAHDIQLELLATKELTDRIHKKYPGFKNLPINEVFQHD